MTSLKINPLLFNNNKNEVSLSSKSFEWKKQISTFSKKKDLSAIEFLNSKYGSKIKQFHNEHLQLLEKNKDKNIKYSPTQNDAVVFAYFDYDDDSTIYLMYIPSDDNIKSNPNPIELNFDTYIPSLNVIEIVDGSYNIECLEEKIVVKGYVYGFCLSNETYYFKKIIIDQYIEFVQRNNIQEDEDDKNMSYSDNESEKSDDKNCNSEDDDDDDDDDDDNDDDVDEDVNDVNNIDNIDNDNDDDDDEDDDEDIDDEDNTEKNDDEETLEEQNTGNEDENLEDNLTDNLDQNTADIDNDIDIDNFEIKKKVRQKKIKPLKCQLHTSIEDFNIILNVLKPESKTTILSDLDLHQKRQINIKIFEKIKLPKKTIQLIEKGIYNYTIEKCNLRDILPLWDNPYFLEIYMSKSKNIYSNLNSKSYVNNIKLIEKIKNGSILPYDLAFIDTHKLFPERWADIIDEKLKVDKMLNESLQESATDIFECPRCHKNKTIYLQIQLRSSDEPMTNFITCMNCGNKWQIE
jgi:DNA-directed RNA polymerase subunit M/transcription elongation factor TFIIS